ncbi:MaoC family dehydratase, partial [Pseudomonas sp. MWU13-2860]
MLDSRHIGHVLTPHRAVVEAGRLRFFAKATGQSDPVY